MITIDQFRQLFPDAVNPGEWVLALTTHLPAYEINIPQRVRAFLAQCGHESQGFTAVVENLNYSAAALTSTWPKRFPPAAAEQYARQPERIANRAYADRMGNGPESSGDGWKFRGKGCIQITGRDNVTAFAKHAGMSLEAVCGYLLTIQGAVHSACWWWKNNGCNELADGGSVDILTKRINGGTNGLEDRIARYELVGRVIA